MANKIQITRSEAQEFYDAFDHFFPDSGDYINSSYLKWSDRKAFTDDIKAKTNVDITSGNPRLIKNSQDVLESLVVGKAEEAKETTETVPDKARREAMEAERVRRETALKESAANAKKEVEAAIKRQQEIHEKLKGKTIYRKVTTPQEAALSAEKVAALEVMRNGARSNPKDATDALAKEIEARIRSSIPPGVDEANITALSKRAASRVIQNLRGNSLAEEALTANKLLSQKDLLNQIAPSESQALLDSAANVGTTQIIEYHIDQKIITNAFGDGAEYMLGPKNIDNINIELSATPKDGFEAYDLSKITGQQLEFLDHQGFIFDSIRGYGAAELKSVFLRQVGTWIENSIPTEGFAAEVFQSSAFQAAFSYFGLGEPIIWEGTTFFGRTAIQFGLGDTFGYLGRFTGFNFGVSEASAAIVAESSEAGATIGGAAGVSAAAILAGETTATAGAIATTGGIMASEAFLGGAGAAAAGAAAGTAIPVPVVGTLVGAAAGAVAVPVINKIKDLVVKGKDFIVGAIGAVAVGGIFLASGGSALTGAILGGFGGFGLSRFFTSGTSVGATASSVVSGIVGAFSAIWATFMGAIGGPLLAILIGFPALVVIILVIINSGAYVTPLGGLAVTSTNPYISVEKKAEPGGQLSGPTPITYTITISSKKDTLTGIKIKAECHATKKGSSLDCPSEQIPTPPASITAGTPFSFTFTTNYGSQYQDSLISNTVTVNAVSDSGGKVSEVGSSSVCFGKCPLDCFAFPDQYWPQNPDVQKLKNLLTGAAGTLSGQYPNFAAKVCKSGTINLCYNPNKVTGGIFALHEHSQQCDIDFSNSVTSYGSEGVLFLLTHEVTHHIQKISPGYFTQYMDKVNPPISEKYICTRGLDDPYESMAEGDALLVAKPIIDKAAGCLTTSFQSQYPKHYNFAKNVMFTP